MFSLLLGTGRCACGISRKGAACERSKATHPQSKAWHGVSTNAMHSLATALEASVCGIWLSFAPTCQHWERPLLAWCEMATQSDLILLMARRIPWRGSHHAMSLLDQIKAAKTTDN